VSERRHETEDKAVALAYRLFHDGEENALFREEREAIEAHKNAQGALDRCAKNLWDVQRRTRERRTWFAANALEALGLPAPDPSFDEAWAYSDYPRVVLCVRRKEVQR
jgi:hypothetical protein